MADIDGTANGETLTGTADADLINALAGEDEVFGRMRMKVRISEVQEYSVEFEKGLSKRDADTKTDKEHCDGVRKLQPRRESARSRADSERDTHCDHNRKFSAVMHSLSCHSCRRR